MAKKSKTNKIFKKIGMFISILLFIFAYGTLGLVTYMGILPSKYLYPAIGVVVFITLILFITMLKPKGKKIFKVIAWIISLAITAICAFADWNIYKTYDFLADINKTKATYENYYVMVRKNSAIERIEDIKDMEVQVFDEDTEIYDEALAKLKKKVSVDIDKVRSVSDLGTNLLTEKSDVIFISEVSKTTIEDDNKDFKDKTKIIETIKVKVDSKNTATKKPKNKDIFTIYSGGTDSYGTIYSRSRSDVNMLVTINKKNHEILLVSIPRDYYITLNGKGAKDKLTHAGIYGVETSIKSIEDFMDVDINYYFRVNFSTLTKVVDTIDGVDVYSDRAFVPWTDRSVYINKGMNHMNGKKALAFARERYAYKEGDVHRVQNQQAVITAIIKKVSSNKSILLRYSSILDSLQGSFQTNVTMNEISALVNEQLNSMPDWQIAKYNLNGTGAHKSCYSMGAGELYVMIPNEETVDQASDYINDMIDGKTLEDLGLSE